MNEDELHRLENDDHELVELYVRPDDVPPDGDWERLGRAIGRSKHLKKLVFQEEVDIPEEHRRSFFLLVSCNRSIKDIRFWEDDLLVADEGNLFHILTPLFKGNNLERLVFSCDNECVEAHEISSVLLGFNSLRSLNLHALWCYDDNAATDLVQALARHSDLEELMLSGCDFGYEALASLLQSPNSKLYRLTLRDERIDDRAAVALAPRLGGSSALRDLRLTRIRGITGVGWRAIFTALQTSGCSLEELDLSHNDINDAAMDSIIVVLASSGVSTLDLGHNRSITVAGWRTFSEFLCTASCMLHTLYLRGNRFITDEAIGFLTNGLANNNTLRELDMSFCGEVTEAGWTSFATVLQSEESNLEQLCLFRCGNAINDTTAIALAESLVGNSTLLGLELRGNSITDDGWAAFSEVLCNGSSIEGTYGSNHTLQRLRGSDPGLPGDVVASLELNSAHSNSEAARRKVIETHFRDGFVGAPPFISMELSLTPHALAWMGRGGESGEVEWRLYGFLRSVPSLLGK